MAKSRLSVKMYVSYSTVTRLTYISWCLLLSDSALMQCGGHVRSKPEDYYASQKSFRYADLHFHSFADVLYGYFLENLNLSALFPSFHQTHKELVQAGLCEKSSAG